MRAKSILLLMLALGCGLVASIGITQVMSKRNSDRSTGGGETGAIFVALQDIPMGDLITADVLKLEEWPKDKIPEGALAKIEDVEGRRPKSKLYNGFPILDTQLLGKGVSEGGAAPQIPVGYRVVSVKVDDESGISNLIRPRDRVDVLLYTKRTPGTIIETSTRTILQDIQVFAINEVFDLAKTTGEESINAKTVSLLVTPKQAELVMLATELGQVRLALRSHEDKEQSQLAGAFPHELDQADPSSRNKEELLQTASATGKSGEMDGFLQLLNSRGAPSPAVPVVEEASEQWTVQLIQGPEVTEIVLEMVNDSAQPNAAEAGSSRFDFWRPISPTRGTSPAAAPVDPGAGDRNPNAGDRNPGTDAPEGGQGVKEAGQASAEENKLHGE